MQNNEAKTKPLITDHAFQPSTCYPEGQGCAHIVHGAEWTTYDPIRCRRPENEHAVTERSNAGANSTPREANRSELDR